MLVLVSWLFSVIGARSFIELIPVLEVLIEIPVTLSADNEFKN